MRISAVVVNYNSRSHLSDCIRGLLQYLNLQDGGDEIIIVDNQSTDESLALIESFSGPKIIRSHTNVGYGGGCNIGSEHTNGDIILFMNPDATLISPVNSIRNVFKKNTNCALVAPRILTQGCIYDTVRPLPTVISDALGELGIAPWVSHRRRYKSINTGEGKRIYFTGFSSGCAIFVRREAFERVGGFDAEFFLYYEEIDLCKRFADFGYSFFYDNRCIVRHALGGSSHSLKWRMTAIRFNSKLRYFSKHSSKTGLMVHKTATLIVLFLKFLLYLLGIKVGSNAPDKYRAYLYGIRLYLRGYTPWNL